MAKKTPFKHHKSTSYGNRSGDKSTAFHTKKALGQHFLTDTLSLQQIQHSIENAIQATPVCVHEIGPGAAALTDILINMPHISHLTALEKDPRAVEYLQQRFMHQKDKISVIETDILAWSPPTADKRAVCIGNLPYYITSPILFWFFSHQDFYSDGLFMVQKEVALRLCAKPGTKNYGRLSVAAQLRCQVQIDVCVPASAFTPPPLVDSAFVHLRFLPTKIFSSEEQRVAFEQWTAHLFHGRRKKIHNTLKTDATFQKFVSNRNEAEVWAIIDPDLRPEAFSPEQLWNLYVFLTTSTPPAAL